MVKYKMKMSLSDTGNATVVMLNGILLKGVLLNVILCISVLTLNAVFECHSTKCCRDKCFSAE